MNPVQGLQSILYPFNVSLGLQGEIYQVIRFCRFQDGGIPEALDVLIEILVRLFTEEERERILRGLQEEAPE